MFRGPKPNKNVSDDVAVLVQAHLRRRRDRVRLLGRRGESEERVEGRVVHGVGGVNHGLLGGLRGLGALHALRPDDELQAFAV